VAHIKLLHGYYVKQQGSINFLHKHKLQSQEDPGVYFLKLMLSQGTESGESWGCLKRILWTCKVDATV